MLNGFYPLSERNPPPVPKGQYQDRWNTNKLFYIMFQVLKVLLIKLCKIHSLHLLFLVVSISFYISRYNFSQVFRTSFNIIWKKTFVTNLPFLTDSLVKWKWLKLLYSLKRRNTLDWQSIKKIHTSEIFNSWNVLYLFLYVQLVFYSFTHT